MNLGMMLRIGKSSASGGSAVRCGQKVNRQKALIAYKEIFGRE